MEAADRAAAEPSAPRVTVFGDDDRAHYAVALACSYNDASWAHTINRSGSRRWYSSVRRAWLSCTLFRSNASRGSMTLMGRGNLRLPVHCSRVVERVPAVQHPTVAGVDSDTRVPSRVARQRHQHDSRRDVVEFLGGCEPSPLLPVGIVLDELGSMGPLGGAEADLLSERRVHAPRRVTSAVVT